MAMSESVAILAIMVTQVIALILAMLARTEARQAKVEARIIKEINLKTHALVNSRMGAQLRLNMEQAEYLASLPGSSDASNALAARARALLDAHEVNQHLADEI